MIYSCFIVDDNQPAAELIGRYVKRMSLTLLGLETDPLIALDKIRNMESKPDIVFLDISMPGMDGLELAAALKPFTKIIFTTAYRSYAPESYQLDALYYLLKPITFEDFQNAITKVSEAMPLNEEMKRSTKEFVNLPGSGKGGIIRLRVSDAIYFESALHYITIYTEAKQYVVHSSMNDIIVEFGGLPFIRVQKSFAVNLDKVIEVRDNTIHLSNGSKISLGSTYKEAFMITMRRIC